MKRKQVPLTINPINFIQPNTNEYPLYTMDYTGKTLVVRESFYKPGYLKADSDRRFYCTGGFGAIPDKIGTKCFGIFLSDGERSYIRRSDAEGIAQHDGEKEAESKAKEWDKTNPF